MIAEQINQPTCGYCHSKNSKRLFKTVDIYEDNYSIQKCDDCNVHFLSPKPTEDKLARAYDTAYYGNDDVKFSNPMFIETVIDYFRKSRARRLSKYLADGNTVLDIGCGNGRFLKYLDTFGKYKLRGLEIDGDSAQRALKETKIELTISRLENAGFNVNSFDAITLFHVFEHLPNQKEVLDIISNILKPNGVLVISFPNITSVQSKIFKGKWLHLDPPRHLFLFEPKEFKKIMSKKGFQLVKETYISSEQNPYGMVQSTLNLVVSKRDLLYEHLKGNTDYSKDHSRIGVFIQKLFFISSFPVFMATDVLVGLFNKGATVEFIFRNVGSDK